MIALCAKCYSVDEQDSDKKKFSTKGMSKRQNNISWQRFKAALNGSVDRAENQGFRKVCSGGAKRMATYEQQKLGLSAYHEKRWALSDGIHAEPIEFHMTKARGSCVFGGTPNSSSQTKPGFEPSCEL